MLHRFYIMPLLATLLTGCPGPAPNKPPAPGTAAEPVETAGEDEQTQAVESEPGTPQEDASDEANAKSGDASSDATEPESTSAIDTDEDGILDSKDECPDSAEVYNAVEDDDGCPDEPASLVELDLESQEIRILEPVVFEINKGQIKPESYPMLEHIASLIRYHEAIERVEIGAHTDAKSAEARQHYSMRLEQRRADSVFEFLVQRGVEPDRLRALGYAAERPIASNKTAEGRRKNRRIEFRLLNARAE